MFKYAASMEQLGYPNRTVRKSTVGPVVWTTSEVGNTEVLVALNGLEFWECVRTGLPLLDESQRDELVRLAGGYNAAEQQVVLDRAALAETELEAARADLDGLAMQIAQKVVDNVIDLDAERAKRRPAPTAA